MDRIQKIELAVDLYETWRADTISHYEEAASFVAFAQLNRLDYTHLNVVQVVLDYLEQVCESFWKPLVNLSMQNKTAMLICADCEILVFDSDACLKCHICNTWWHKECTQLREWEFNRYADDKRRLFNCRLCSIAS